LKQRTLIHRYTEIAEWCADLPHDEFLVDLIWRHGAHRAAPRSHIEQRVLLSPGGAGGPAWAVRTG
jgi:hypothetical protein